MVCSLDMRMSTSRMDIIWTHTVRLPNFAPKQRPITMSVMESVRITMGMAQIWSLWVRTLRQCRHVEI